MTRLAEPPTWRHGFNAAMALVAAVHLVVLWWLS